MPEPTQQTPPPKNPDGMIHIQTLFGRLTELIMSTCISREGVANSMVMVGRWASVIFASLIIMIAENKNQSDIKADQITLALNKEIKRHMIMLRGMKKDVKKGESRIILPKGMTRG